MKNKIFGTIKKHKIITGIIIIGLAGGGYYFYSAKSSGAAPASYVIGKAEKGAIMTSVSGTGQVSATNQVDLKPQISAKIISINVKSGQTVKSGDLLAVLDSKDLEKQVRDAKNSLNSATANYNLKVAGITPEDEKVAKNSVASAKLAYENSLIALESAKTTANDDLLRAQRSLEDAQRSYDTAVANQGLTADSKTTDIDNAYISAKNAVSSAYTSIRSSIVTIDGMLGMNNYNNSNNAYQSSIGIRNPQTLTTAKNSYDLARSALIKFESGYQVSGWTSEETENLLKEAISAAQATRKMAQDTYTMLTYSVTSTDLSETTLSGLKSSASSAESSSAASITSLQSATQSIASAKLNQNSSDISSSGSVASAKSSLETAKSNLEQVKVDNAKSIQSAESDIKSKKISLENSQAQYDLKVAKPRDVDLAASRIQIQQARESYNTALENLSEAKIISPIDGVVAKVYQNPGDLSSVSQSTALITIVTNNQLATVDLNEVDAAKVKAGQKAALTFSAIDGLEITGSVVEMDGVGTVTQGVVTYSVQIALDTQDARIKPEMSVSATITTDQKFDALLVPNSAIKNDANGLSYVETLKGATAVTDSNGIASEEAPEIKFVQTGLTGDTNTEIIEGLSAGDLIIIKTVSSASTGAQATQQNSAFGALGGGGGAGVRVMR